MQKTVSSRLLTQMQTCLQTDRFTLNILRDGSSVSVSVSPLKESVISPSVSMEIELRGLTTMLLFSDLCHALAEFCRDEENARAARVRL